MLALGFSINVLTMFGMVLAIGIIVDDAIVVVENVERIMAEEGLPPREATIKAMRDHRRGDRHHPGADRGVHSDGVGQRLGGRDLRQFTVSMAVSILFSALLALSLTPALCHPAAPEPMATMVERLFGAFNRGFERMTGRYQRGVASVLQRSGLVMGVFAALVAALLLGLHWLPSAFLPEETRAIS
jgi:multidrug efflux pump